MSVNPGATFQLKSIVREGRPRRGKLRRPKVQQEVTINVGPSEDPDKPLIEDAPSTAQTNQFLPGAVALNSFILMFFLFYLERKDHIKFSSVLVVTYPSFVGCDDNTHCVLESTAIDLQNTNVTYLFIFILMFVGYSPAHILYLTNEQNRAYYERVKNVASIVCFSVLFAIIQGQHKVLFQITIALNNSIIFGIGIILQYNSNYNFRSKAKGAFYATAIACVAIQTAPTITAYANKQHVPKFLYVLVGLWISELFIELLLHYRPNMSYLHLVVQILLSWAYTFIFWEYGKIDE